mmetsp:Transcript_47032/g.122403  ORF Transcript_47032/g.122403 Transcript_47032/m.122403 type:complete len:1119 (+) Transcript_47032:95-3451(+)
MKDDEEDSCPLCMQPLDETDHSFFACPCNYQVCLFCVHYIMEQMNGKCPACRQDYAETSFRYDARQAQHFRERVADKRKANEKEKHKVANPRVDDKSSEEQERDLRARHAEQLKQRKGRSGRRDLNEMRVLQRNVVHILGLTANIAKAEVLRRREFFGQYGKLSRVIVSNVPMQAKLAGNNAANNATPLFSAYLTFENAEDAHVAIQAVDGFNVDGHVLRASFGTTRYCRKFLEGQTCDRKDCGFLHKLVDENGYEKGSGKGQKERPKEAREKDREKDGQAQNSEGVVGQNCEASSQAKVNEKKRPSMMGKAAATSTAAEKNQRHHSPVVVTDRPLVGSDMDQTAVELNQPEPSGVHSDVVGDTSPRAACVLAEESCEEGAVADSSNRVSAMPLFTFNAPPGSPPPPSVPPPGGAETEPMPASPPTMPVGPMPAGPPPQGAPPASLRQLLAPPSAPPPPVLATAGGTGASSPAEVGEGRRPAQPPPAGAAPTAPPLPERSGQPPTQPPSKAPVQPPSQPPTQPPMQPPTQPPAQPPSQPPQQPPCMSGQGHQFQQQQQQRRPPHVVSQPPVLPPSQPPGQPPVRPPAQPPAASVGGATTTPPKLPVRSPAAEWLAPVEGSPLSPHVAVRRAGSPSIRSPMLAHPAVPAPLQLGPSVPPQSPSAKPPSAPPGGPPSAPPSALPSLGPLSAPPTSPPTLSPSLYSVDAAAPSAVRSPEALGSPHAMPAPAGSGPGRGDRIPVALSLADEELLALQGSAVAAGVPPRLGVLGHFGAVEVVAGATLGYSPAPSQMPSPLGSGATPPGVYGSTMGFVDGALMSTSPPRLPQQADLDVPASAEDDLSRQLSSPTSTAMAAAASSTGTSAVVRTPEAVAAGYPHAMMHPSSFLQQARRAYDMPYDRGSAYEPSFYGAAASVEAAYEAALYGADVPGMARHHHHHNHFGQAPLSAASTGSPPGVSKEDGVEMLQALFPNTRISVMQVPQASTGMPRPPMIPPFGATGMPGGGLLGAAGFLGGGLGPHSLLLGPAVAGAASPGMFRAAAPAAGASAIAAAAMQQHSVTAAATAAGTMPASVAPQGCGANRGTRGNHAMAHSQGGNNQGGGGGGGGGGGNRRRRADAE